MMMVLSLFQVLVLYKLITGRGTMILIQMSRFSCKTPTNTFDKIKKSKQTIKIDSSVVPNDTRNKSIRSDLM